MNSPFYKSGGFPEIKKENEGKFTAWAKKDMPGSSDDAGSAASQA